MAANKSVVCALLEDSFCPIPKRPMAFRIIEFNELQASASNVSIFNVTLQTESSGQLKLIYYHFQTKRPSIFGGLQFSQ